MKTHTIRATEAQAFALAQIAGGGAFATSSGNTANGGVVISYECSKSVAGAISAHRCIRGDAGQEIYQMFRVWPTGQTDRI